MSLVKQGYFGAAGGGKNTAVVDAWLISRFSGMPAQDAVPPAGVPDAGPTITGTAEGGPGSYLLTMPSASDYYIRVQYGDHSYWSLCPAGSIAGQAEYAQMPFPSGDTTGATDGAALAAAQAQLPNGAGAVIFQSAPPNNPYWLPAGSGNIPSYQHWWGKGMGATILKLVNSQNADFIVTNGFSTYRETSIEVTATVTGCTVTNNSPVITGPPGSFSSVRAGDLTVGSTGIGNAIPYGATVLSVANTSVTMNVPANYGAAGSIQTSSVPTGWGLHHLTLDGNSHTNKTNVLAAPASPSVSATTGSGSTPWFYTVTALNSIGETVGSAEVTCNNASSLSAGVNENTVSWSAVSGATSYNLYRSSGAGATLKEKLYAVLGNVTSYVDKGAGSVGSTVSYFSPMVNTTGGRVLGTYGYGWIVEQVEIKEGGSAGWDCQANYTRTFNYDVNYPGVVKGLSVHGNLQGGVSGKGTTDMLMDSLRIFDNGSNYSHTQGTGFAQLDLNTAGTSVTNYHFWGNLADYAIRICGKFTVFSNGAIENEPTANLLILGNQCTVDAVIYGSDTSNSSIAVIDAGQNNTLRLQVSNTMTGVLKRTVGTSGANYNITALYTTTAPSPAVLGTALGANDNYQIDVFTNTSLSQTYNTYAIVSTVVFATSTHTTALNETTICTSGTFTVTLPAPAVNGQCVVANPGAGTVTVHTPSGTLYNASLAMGNITLAVGQNITLVSDGTNWYALA